MQLKGTRGEGIFGISTMKLLLVLAITLVVTVHGESLDAEEVADFEGSEPVDDYALGDEGTYDNELLENEQGFENDVIDSLADPDTLEAIEESSMDEQSDPYVFQAIGYYCRLCRVCNTCKKLGKCTGGTIGKACGGCKYCNPKTYWNMIRRIRVRIRLRRLRRWGRSRRRRRRRRRRRG